MRSTVSKKAGWPKSHPAHSPENRIGQAWKPDEVQVIGEDGFGHNKLFKMPDGNYKCSCGHTVKIYKNVVAACEGCGYIFNDPVVFIIPKKSKITTRSFIYKAFDKV
jgi:hypothetical protein